MSERDSTMTETTEQTVNNDSDEEECNDDILYYDDLFTEVIPLQHKCEHELQHTNSFSQCCERCLDDKLMFFEGSLREACQAAFSPTLIQERRPILVYLHNDEKQFKRRFCETIFNSLTIVNYLNMNYVVWPWKVTSNADLHTLANIWKETLSTQFIDNFCIEKCSWLIGIMRQFEYERDELTVSEYQYEILVKGDTFARTITTVDHNILYNKLTVFKEKCDINEQNLSFSFVKKTRLCWDIILEIARYLSLNDAISAFSIRILFLLQNSQSKFQLSKLYDPFIKTILPKINEEQIISLQLNERRMYSYIEEDLPKFRQVVSVSLHGLSYSYKINKYMETYPNLTRLSLTYDNEVDYELLNGILNRLKQKIQRFEIYCSEILGNQTDENSLNQTSNVITSIKYFLLNTGHYARTSTNRYLQHYKPIFFITKIGFISKIPYIQYIHLIIKSNDIEHFLDHEQWKIPVQTCFSLKKITLKVLGNTTDPASWIKKVSDIQTTLRIIQPKIKFQINFS